MKYLKVPIASNLNEFDALIITKHKEIRIHAKILSISTS